MQYKNSNNKTYLFNLPDSFLDKVLNCWENKHKYNIHVLQIVTYTKKQMCVN